MSCISPLPAVRSDYINANGKFPMLFDSKSLSKVHFDDLQWMPCGRCVTCRLKNSSDWSFRMLCEAKMHPTSSFITLTFSPDNVPTDGSLNVDTFKDFMKRLRRRLDYYYGVKIRFFHCGEYGDLNFRPHYHAVIFGWDFPDKIVWKNSPSGFTICRSPLLEELWPFGFSSVGAVSFESCAYVARYVLKKRSGDLARERYERVDPFTGELFIIQPEYATMSRMPGIGYDFFKSHYTDIYPKDFMTFGDGRRLQPPPYFDDLLKKFQPDLFDEVKINRSFKNQYKEPFSFSRADSIRKCFEAKIKSLVRTLDNS